MNQEEILQAVADYVEQKMTGEGSGHDWWHIVRVQKMAQKIALNEGGNSFICQLAALVHDLVDDKLVVDEAAGLAEVSHLLAGKGVPQPQIEEVLTIIQRISYKAGTQNHLVLSLEGQIVQDADRLDAIVAIGIARTMTYSGYKNRIIHEGGNSFICQLAALVHDLVDDKLVMDEAAGLAEVSHLLAEKGVPQLQIEEVLTIIQRISYKAGTQNHLVLSLEGQIVQDADRLDAIGAIGIARTMAYSGYKNRIIHDPTVPIREEMTLEEYRSHQGTAIAHFYEKLLKLTNLMHTDTAKKFAQGRHQFLKTYLEQFEAEWEGRR